MSDIQLFRYDDKGVSELPGKSAAIEKDLQKLIESHMEAFLGVRFLATEYSTGKTHKGRIDSLGLDENNTPVIIEYKRQSNENVINQGLFYLDWLLDHQAEFRWLVMDKFGKQVADDIDWSNARVICIAADFTKYDEHAVTQINRNINLIRYKLFNPDLLMFELVNAVNEAHKPQHVAIENQVLKQKKNAQRYRLSKSSPELVTLYQNICDFADSLGDEVQRKELLLYTAFQKIKNFLSVVIWPTAKEPHIKLYLKLKPEQVIITDIVRDVTNLGHWGTGDIEVVVRNQADLAKAKLLIEQAYQEN
ncbi:TPA: DUF91 domain-containing protein [Escherichia coli]|nr:DUF91 domain-containing protein [Escherichia coli]HEA6984735.1 DUF91 domain-containing protein [Escherichia coli]